ncbi:c-type cytochrome [Pandoraea fibrosis]|uniref:C-type cytochrome n=1 Tax=Pandoraea fibrosis TaxID=1891094 RepID=A0A5E4YKY1_9BURK|nr:cytochrome c [Pandoraea fibrosis]QHE93443.1 c-type cytochrome [Pandoraea fibrosis]QHF12995.1 c-type cytochrome [Pandoraea fibrosis]VVE49434.1 sulfonate ABC transporter ATP-binding protein SsuB [Pandoraea fibrosis]
MTSPPSHLWLGALLQVLQFVQSTWLSTLYALGITDDSHGAPAWPWDVRIAGENLVIDVALARQFAWMLAAIAFALVCVLLALFWRRAWRWLLAAGIGALALAPWPSPSLWLSAAVPTSFHTSPTGFTVESIARGSRVYAAQCAACHGTDGRGEGPLAATLHRWPPTMASTLLSRRADGELFWHVLYGMRDDQGVTMPGFSGRLSDREIWAALDYMRVLSASAGMAAGGSWPVPIALPALSVKCANGPARDVATWRGNQRVRVVAVDTDHPPPFEDPRFLTLLVERNAPSPPGASGIRKVAARPSDRVRTVSSVNAGNVTPLFGARADCVADSPEAWQVFAQIAGASPSSLAGTEWLADRDGWLRALAPAGRGGWADGGLMCTTTTALPSALPLDAQAARRTDPLTATLRQMDDDPVRFVKGGFVH